MKWNRNSGHFHKIKNILIAALVVASLIILVKSEPMQYYFSNPAALRTAILEFGILAPIIIIGLQAFQTTLSIIPSQITTIVAGFIFGPWLGLGFSMVGALLGSAFTFWIGRRYGKNLALKIFPKKEIVHFQHFFRQKNATAVFLARVSPIFPNDLVSFAAGLTTISFLRFNVISTIGFAIQMVVLTYFGSALSSGTSGMTLIILGSIVILLLAVTLFKDALKRIIIRDFKKIEKRIEEEFKKI